MRGEREEAPPSDQKGVFTVQDNFNLFIKDDGTSPILLPHSNYFIAADTININIPIFSMFSHPTQPNKDPLANMLYANLQIKKILEEYAATQKRANDLLGQPRAIMPSGKIAIADSAYKSPSISREKSQGKQQTIKHELDQIQARLASTRTTGTESASSAITHNSKNKSATKNQIITFRELHNQVKMQTQMSTANSMTHSAQAGKISTHNKLNQNLYEQNTQTEPRTSSQSRSAYSDSGEISLPWILDLPFKIFNYILAHKITALVVCLILLLLFNFIFGARS